MKNYPFQYSGMAILLDFLTVAYYMNHLRKLEHIVFRTRVSKADKLQ